MVMLHVASHGHGVCCMLHVASHGHVARQRFELRVAHVPPAASGFFPDVGGSHFLSRLAGGLGAYIALTVHTQTHARKHRRTYAHTQTHKHRRARTHASYTHTQHMRTHTHAYTPTHGHTHTHAHTHTDAHTATHSHTHTHADTVARTHTHSRTQAHTRTHARTTRSWCRQPGLTGLFMLWCACSRTVGSGRAPRRLAASIGGRTQQPRTQARPRPRTQARPRPRRACG